jgi:hypothetical protein
MRRVMSVHSSKIGRAGLVLGVALAAWLAAGAPSYMG